MADQRAVTKGAGARRRILGDTPSRRYLLNSERMSPTNKYVYTTYRSASSRDTMSSCVPLRAASTTLSRRSPRYRRCDPGSPSVTQIETDRDLVNRQRASRQLSEVYPVILFGESNAIGIPVTFE